MVDDEPIKTGLEAVNKGTFTVGFVCTANMCRSAMAQGLFKARLREAGLEDRIAVRGGGTHAAPGYPATSDAVAVMAERGVDISAHRSQPVTRQLLDRCDLVLTATTDQARHLAFEFPGQAAKVSTLRGFGRPPDWQGIEEVDDPVGRGREAYQLTADLLAEQIDRVWPLLPV